MVSRRRIIKDNSQQQVVGGEDDASKTRAQRATRTRPKKASAAVERDASADKKPEAAVKLKNLDQAKNVFRKQSRHERKEDSFHDNLLDDALSFDWAEDDDDDDGGDGGGEQQHQKQSNQHNNKWQRRPHGRKQLGKNTGEEARPEEREDAASYDDDHGQRRLGERDLCQNFDPYSIYGDEDDEEDVWYSEERLKQDHIQEIVNKWHSIDDEIWAKIICMEQNRRIAKAYARQRTININGSRDEYLDGTTLGLNSFENPDRDSKTSYIKQHIGEGIKIKIHQNGDIFVKRLSRSSVFVHHFKPADRKLALKGSQSSSDVYALNSSEGGLGDFYGVVRPRQDKNAKRRPANFGKHADKNSSSSASSQATPPPAKSANTGSGLLIQVDKVVRLFSMGKFKQALEFESRKSAPNRARLLNMCISVVSFVMNDQKMLNLPSWVMVINIVAMDLLSSEIGLVEPFDELLPPPPQADSADHWAGVGKGKYNRLRVNRSFERFHVHDYENDEDDEEALKKWACCADGACCEAAKDAPMYNSDELYRDGSEDYESRTRGKKLPVQTRSQTGNKGERAAKEINSDGELNDPAANNRHLNERPRNAVEQLGSSSSGFVSSHRNDDSSANSSSSNIANSDRPAAPVAAAKKESAFVLKPSRFRQKLLANKERGATATKSDIGQAAPREASPAAVQQRGKRAPKMPHGLEDAQKLDSDSLSSESEAVIMSGPIPIPAPPTSLGGPPSGKANLILVSPTGLSLPPEKVHCAGDVVEEKRAQKQSSRLQGPPEEPNKAKLPLGIPAHAQLAPPATRKHILRYLMSMGQQPTPRAQQQQQQQKQQQQPPETFPKPPDLERTRQRAQRPLPVLPSGLRQPRQQADESLYYRGLQARVMQTRPHALQPHHAAAPYEAGQQWAAVGVRPQPAAPVDVTNIIGNFRSNALFRQQLAKHSQPNQHHFHAAGYQMAVSTAQHKQKESKSRKKIGLDAIRPPEEARKPYVNSLDSLNVKTTPSRSHMSSLTTLLNSVGNLLKGN